MGIENSAGLGVNNVYGPRVTAEGRSGEIKTAGKVKEVQLDFRGDNYSSVSAILPAGSLFLQAIATIEEVFVTGGTSPTINVGTSGSHGTNFAIELSAAQAQATGTVVNETGAGTFTSVLAAATTLVVGLDGTSPTLTSAGKAKITIRYLSNV